MSTTTQELLEKIEKNNQEARAHLAEYERAKLEKAQLEQSRLKAWAEFIKNNLSAITGGKP